MSFKLTLSKRCIELLDRCVEDFGLWHFDAINAPMLLNQLVMEQDSGFEEYFINLEVDLEDEVYAYATVYLSDRQMELQIKENDKTVIEYKSEHDSDIVVRDEDGKWHKYPAQDEFTKIIMKMSDICQENNIKCAQPMHLTCGMFKADMPVLKKLFSELGENYLKAKEYFTSKSFFMDVLIPDALSGFLACLNDKIDVKKPCEILMRDKEVEQIWNISLKKNKRNTVIVGEAGVGKSALIEKITYDIEKGICPERFKQFKVISLDVNSLIAGTTFRGEAEQRIKELIEFLEKRDNVILFIDEVHTILGAGSCYEGEMDLSNALKPILARGDTIVIGATTEHEYETYFARDAALSRRFERVTVEEPKVDEVYPMIRNKIRALSKFHGIKISKSIVEYAILIANCFAFEKKNPDKTLDLIDRSMVVAYRKGKIQVDKECVLENFGIFYDLFDGMGEEARMEIAYHEAGHYIVGKVSDKLVRFKMLAVSIMPAENYMGVTCYEFRKDRVPFTNKDYFIDSIAFHLGGRVAEKVFRKEFTSGAGQDLNNATRLAFTVITKYGITANSEERNSIFLNTQDYPMFSEKATNLINDEVQNLITLAYKRAESIINEHKDLLEAIVKQLLEKKIMSEIELNRICKKYLK